MKIRKLITYFGRIPTKDLRETNKHQFGAIVHGGNSSRQSRMSAFTKLSCQCTDSTKDTIKGISLYILGFITL